MAKLIEVVCTGNQGRSPVAELIARNHLKIIRAYGDYDSISSGTLVDTIQSGEFFTLPIMGQLIGLARQRTLYSPEEMREIDTALRQGDNTTIEKYFRRTIDLFDREEVENRAEVLLLLGIQGEVKSIRDQTVSRRDTVAVFPVDKSNYGKIIDIYKNSDYGPFIDVLSRYATGNPDAELKNTFGKGKEVYRKGVEQMLEEVPRAVNKVIGA